MSPAPVRKSSARSHVLLVAAITGLAVMAAADQIVLKKDVRIKSDTNPFAELVVKVPADTKLELLSDKDGWARVRTPDGKEGFIADGDLPQNATLVAVSGSGETNGVSNDAATRNGFENDTKQYAASKNYDTGGLKKMMDLGDSITEDDLVDFATAGHVGPKKFRH